MKRKLKVKDIYKTKSYNTEKDILNGLYGIMNKKEDIMNKREECLRIANEIVNGAREKDYGTPEDNFQFIADQWASYLNYPIDRQDVANMMILLKIARTKTGTGTDDCFIDMAGYAACAYEMNQDKHPMDDEEKEINFDDCAWGNVEYGDIHMDEDESSMMAEEHYPNKPEDKGFRFEGGHCVGGKRIKMSEDAAETFMAKGYFPDEDEDDKVCYAGKLKEKHACYDEFSGIYFKSNIQEITEAIEAMNQKLRTVGYVSIRRFYNALGLRLERPTCGLGWCLEKNDHVVVSFYSRLEPDGSPCLTICLEPIEYLDYLTREE